jgi:signal transduction histidine kinase
MVFMRQVRWGLPIQIVAGIIIIIALYLASTYSYNLFHSFVEIFSIVIGYCIFVIAWNTRQFLDNNYLLFIGIAYFFVASLDLLHTLSYSGMGVFIGYTADLPTQLWISSRYMESISLILAPIFLHRRLRANITILVYSVITILLLLTIFYWNVFPACFIEGTGLTQFKVISEYIISAILIGALALLLVNRKEFDTTVLRLLIASIIITICAELAFTFYVSVFGLSNMIGHFFKLLSFYLIYRAIIETGLTKPYNLLFRNLKQSELELEKKARELEKANAELAIANKELEAFSYSVSHDLRSPLITIDGFSQALLEDYHDKLDDQGKHYLDRMHNGVKRLAAIIDDLLILSRVSRGEMDKESVDLTAIAQNITDELQRTDTTRNVKFSIATGLSAFGDANLLRLLLENILGNAWKYTSKKQDAIIEMGELEQDGKQVFFVKDNGTGFNMEYVDKIFLPFQRLHSAGQFPGTGIGLATVKRIINRHGGEIWAEGEEEKGATFYFTIGGAE